MFRISRAGREVVDCREVSTIVSVHAWVISVALLCFLHDTLLELAHVPIICISV